MSESEHEPVYPETTIIWEAESLRLTAFPSPSAELGAQDWWKQLIGDEPDSKIMEPKTGVQREEGRIKNDRVDGQLILAIQPNRIDWQLGSILEELPLRGLPTIGSFSEALDFFLEKMLAWLKSTAPAVNRLAFGAVLLQPTSDLKDSYSHISSYLPFGLDEGSSDFSYQINRPRKLSSSDIPDLSVNRLSKWSAIKLSTGIFTGPPDNPNQITEYFNNSTRFAVRLELDINTAPNSSEELSALELSDVFHQLVELGKEIADKGDIK